MDLILDFDRARSGGAGVGDLVDLDGSQAPAFGAPTGRASFDDGADDVTGVGVGVGGGALEDLPSLGLEPAARQAARGRGAVVAAACAEGVVVLATSRGFLLRYHWDEHGSERGACLCV